MSAHYDEIKKIIEKASHYIKRTFENDRLIKYGSIQDIQNLMQLNSFHSVFKKHMQYRNFKLGIYILSN